MICRKEMVGCVYDESGNLVNIVHWNEATRTPKIYEVGKLGLEGYIDFLNHGEYIGSGASVTGKDQTTRDTQEEGDGVDGLGTKVPRRNK